METQKGLKEIRKVIKKYCTLASQNEQLNAATFFNFQKSVLGVLERYELGAIGTPRFLSS
jgi:hypothetical protein